MGSRSAASIGRTVFVLAYLIALTVAGTPGWTAVLAGLSLVALWTTPLVLRDGGSHAADGAVRPRPC
jgi:hypothetical protein